MIKRKGKSLRVKLIFFVLLLLFLYASRFMLNPIYAYEPVDIGYSRIDPSSPIYFLKTVREKLEMMAALTPRIKELRKLEFATRRIRESKTLIGKNEDLIPPTLERYNSQINLIKSEKIEDKEVIERIKEGFTTHIDVLEKMYMNTSNIRTKMFIRSSLNKLVYRKDVESEPKMFICRLFTKEASSSSLNQSEQVILKDRAQYCFDTIKTLQ